MYNRLRESKRVNSAEFSSMVEMAHICTLCNDSAIDFNESKKAYEKVGEATETALCCLVEKANVYSIDKSTLNKKQLGCFCYFISPMLLLSLPQVLHTNWLISPHVLSTS